MLLEVLVTTVAVGLVLLALRALLRRATVLEYERGLRYRRGRFVGLLEPGQHWYAPWATRVVKVDTRLRLVTVAGQELLSADSIGLKLSLAAGFRVADPALAVNTVESFEQALYLELQLALRELVGSRKVEEILEAREQLSQELQERCAPAAAALGLDLSSVRVKDLMFPGQLKQLFAQTVKARQEGLAALERARGETAALRSLANAARMVEGNPNLLSLRLLQSIAESSGHTIVLGVPPGGVVPVRRGEGAAGAAAPDEETSADEP